MRKTIEKIITYGLIGLTIIGITTFFYYNPSKVNISNKSEADIIFKFDDGYQAINIHQKLNKNDLSTIKKILNNKETYWDKPMSVFDENICLRFGNDAFLIAREGGSVIKYRNKYFELSDIELKQLHSVMEKYGAFFPCL